MRSGTSNQVWKVRGLICSFRTMKSAVKDELTIPKQTRYVVGIRMNAIERQVRFCHGNVRSLSLPTPDVGVRSDTGPATRDARAGRQGSSCDRELGGRSGSFEVDDSQAAWDMHASPGRAVAEYCWEDVEAREAEEYVGCSSGTFYPYFLQERSCLLMRPFRI